MRRTQALACLSILLLSSCSIDLGSSLGIGGSNGNESGVQTSSLVVGDEPFAVKAAASVLSQGGSAVDAVTAAYFTLAVTYPVAAGLGGGGICIVHDGATGRNEEFDFLSRDTIAGGAFGVPGNVHGFALMQSVYGNLPWQRDIAPGEGYAATGFPISQALAQRLVASQDAIKIDTALAAEFMDESGKPKAAGAIAANADLAQTLAALRTGGPNGFYKGIVGAKIIAYSQSQSGGIGVPDFARYAPMRGAPQAMQIGDVYVYLPSEHVGAGAFAGMLFDNLNRALSTHVGAGDLQASLVYSLRQALEHFSLNSLPNDFGATGFAALDSNGQAAACAVTMNGPFGSGHTAPGTGVTLSRAPSSGPSGMAAAFLTPVIATEGAGGGASLAGAGAGGPNGTAAIGYALARLASGEPLTAPNEMRSTGEPYDTVNAIACQNGICAALPDPAGHGLGASGNTGQ